jgi:hypothetical protein
MHLGSPAWSGCGFVTLLSSQRITVWFHWCFVSFCVCFWFYYFPFPIHLGFGIFFRRALLWKIWRSLLSTLGTRNSPPWPWQGGTLHLLHFCFNFHSAQKKLGCLPHFKALSFISGSTNPSAAISRLILWGSKVTLWGIWFPLEGRRHALAIVGCSDRECPAVVLWIALVLCQFPTGLLWTSSAPEGDVDASVSSGHCSGFLKCHAFWRSVTWRHKLLQLGFFFSFWYRGLNTGPIPQATPPALFCDGYFFEIGSLELFSWADFKLQSFWSLPPEYLGLQAWATGARQELRIFNVANPLSLRNYLNCPQ